MQLLTTLRFGLSLKLSNYFQKSDTSQLDMKVKHKNGREGLNHLNIYLMKTLFVMLLALASFGFVNDKKCSILGKY